MNLKFKIYNLKFFALLFAGFFWANAAKAVCPVCVVAVGAGLGFSRWLGVDDVVSSIWIGGILVAVTLWTITAMRKRNWGFPFDSIVISLAYYLLVFIPLYYAGIVGHSFNKVLGTDKIIFGAAVGTVIFLLANGLNLYLKKRNGGKVLFYYQKVVIPFVAMALASLIFFILLKQRII